MDKTEAERAQAEIAHALQGHVSFNRRNSKLGPQKEINLEDADKINHTMSERAQMDPHQLVPQLAGKKRSAKNEARFQRDRELAAERNKV